MTGTPAQARRIGIVAGSGMWDLAHSLSLQQVEVETPYGEAKVHVGAADLADLVFVCRHGPDHGLPPHEVNYRANIDALVQLGVRRVLATFGVGSIAPDIPPRRLVAIDQLIDLSGRSCSFFNGGSSGRVHVDVTEPFCAGLRRELLRQTRAADVEARAEGTYACMNGPRLETAAEIRMLRLLGADVVGMTACPEAPLARERKLHYAGIAISMNWAAGIDGPVRFDYQALADIRLDLLAALLATLRTPALDTCTCQRAAGLSIAER